MFLVLANFESSVVVLHALTGLHRRYMAHILISRLSIFYIRAPFFSVSASLVNRLNPDPFAVEGDGHFKDVDDTGGMEGGGMLFVLDLLEGRIENVLHRLIEQSFNVISITGYFP